MEMREFLMSLSDKVNAAREGTDMIDERAMREMPEVRPIDFGAFSFIPDISISGGRTTSMGGEEGNTRFVEDEGGGRIGGSVVLPSGVNFGGGVSGNYYRGKESSPYHNAKYGPGGSVEEYDAYMSLPSGFSTNATYNPNTDDYSIMARYMKEF